MLQWKMWVNISTRLFKFFLRYDRILQQTNDCWNPNISKSYSTYTRHCVKVLQGEVNWYWWYMMFDVTGWTYNRFLSLFWYNLLWLIFLRGSLKNHASRLLRFPRPETLRELHKTCFAIYLETAAVIHSQGITGYWPLAKILLKQRSRCSAINWTGDGQQNEHDYCVDKIALGNLGVIFFCWKV